MSTLALLLFALLSPLARSTPVEEELPEWMKPTFEQAFKDLQENWTLLEIGDPVDSLRTTPSLLAACAELKARVESPSQGADPSPRVDCPSCRPDQMVKQTCMSCFGSGWIGCQECVGLFSHFLSRTQSAVGVEGHYTALVPWLPASFLDTDRAGHPIGNGDQECRDLEHAAHRLAVARGLEPEGDFKCEACANKGVLKCAVKRCKGKLKCQACRGKGEVKRACSDCAGFGTLPDPSAIQAASIAVCSWCNGSQARACGDCILADVSSPAQAHKMAAAHLGQMLDGLKVHDPLVLRGLVDQVCPTCVGEEVVHCQNCNGTGLPECRFCENRKKSERRKCIVCRGASLEDCAPCEGKGRAPCASCKGEGHCLAPCTTCSGLLWAACPGCFRFGTLQWERNAELLEASGDRTGAAAMLAVAKQRSVDRDLSRAFLNSVLGWDWSSFRVMTLDEIEAEELAFREGLDARIEALRAEPGD